MAMIPPEFEALVDLPGEIVAGVQGEPLAPAEHPAFEVHLERFERRLRYEREHAFFGIHPDGVGPTLGQDLGKANPGSDLD